MARSDYSNNGHNDKNGLGHLTPEDRLLLAKARDRLYLYQKTGEAAFTDFLDPARARMFADILSKERDVRVTAFGGLAESERQMLGFAEVELPWHAFPIDALLITFSAKAAPGHRDILGAMVGLGLDRGKIGDITFAEGRANVFVCRSVGGFIQSNMTKAGKCPVDVTYTQLEDPSRDSEFFERGAEEIIITPASMRLDCVLGAALRLPRSKAAELIKSGKVFVNWNEAADNAKILKEGDVITARGFGRVRVTSVEGETRSGRIKVRAVTNH